MAEPPAQAAHLLGWGGSTLAVCLMASPLATVQTVLAERSTRAMPFAQSASTCANASAWLAYGIVVAKDRFVIVPNALGCAASVLQLALFARFGIYRGTESKEKAEDSRA